jgi:hypothetical protein
MPAWVMSLIWYFAEKIGALLWKKEQAWENQREDDAAKDEHAKEVAKEMEDAKTPAELDQADRDVLGS